MKISNERQKLHIAAIKRVKRVFIIAIFQSSFLLVNSYHIDGWKTLRFLFIFLITVRVCDCLNKCNPPSMISQSLTPQYHTAKHTHKNNWEKGFLPIKAGIYALRTLNGPSNLGSRMFSEIYYSTVMVVHRWTIWAFWFTRWAFWAHQAWEWCMDDGF